MAVMLRTLGIPARLAVGFTPGAARSGSGDRLSRSRTENAHSWVEVLFPSFGWVPFEPTPNRQNVAAYPYLDPDSAGVRARTAPRASRTGAAGARSAVTTRANSTGARDGRIPTAAPRRAPVRGVRAARSRGIANAAARRGRSPPATSLLAGALGAALGARARCRPSERGDGGAGCVAPAPSRARLILATYDVFTDRAAELGHPRTPGQTLEEYRRAVAVVGRRRRTATSTC